MKSISCPVCESRNTSKKYITEECTVYKCQSCTHLFTPENTIIRKESYGSNYYKEVHKNWFDNPHYGLFDLIFLQIKSHFLNYPNFLSLKVLDVGCGKCQLLSYLSDIHGIAC